MKQKNGAWLLALAAMLCSIGGVCIKGVPWTPLAINGARNAIAACITGAFLWRPAAPALERSRGLRRAEPCADNEPVCIRHQAGRARPTLFC